MFLQFYIYLNILLHSLKFYHLIKVDLGAHKWYVSCCKYKSHPIPKAEHQIRF